MRAIIKQAAPPPETKMALAFRQSHASWLTRGFLPAVAAIACWHRRLSRHSVAINASREGGSKQVSDARLAESGSGQHGRRMLFIDNTTVSSTCCDIWRASAYTVVSDVTIIYIIIMW